MQGCLDCTEYGPDGCDDLTLKFKIREVAAAIGVVDDRECVELHLTGELLDGTPVEGFDTLPILKRE